VRGAAGEEVLGEERDVGGAFAERRHVDVEHVEPPVEVLAEAAVGDSLLEVAVGGGDEADVEAARLGGAEAAHLAFLEGAEQLGLERGGQLGDLVEEERAAVCGLEQAGLVAVGAGECALLVAEQLGLEQVLGQGRAVDGDEAAGAAGQHVQCAGDELLAGAALAGDEDRAWRTAAARWTRS
jgi:hypothetical protein